MSRSIWLVLMLLVSLVFLVSLTGCSCDGGSDKEDIGFEAPRDHADDTADDDDSTDDTIDDDDSADDTADDGPVPSDEIGVFVAKTGDDANPGTMALPKLTIAAGITLAETAAKAVFVAEGLYDGSVTSSVSLYGGYESLGWTRNIADHVTTIKATGNATALTLDGADPIIVQGFTIKGGFGNSENGSIGVETHGITTLSNNTIQGGFNLVISQGVVNSPFGTMTLANNTIDGGSGNRNYGVYSGGTAMLANDNTINGGSGSDSFGVYIGYGAMTLENNRIDGGSGRDNSSGVANFNMGPATLTNNTIDGGSGSDSLGVSTGGGATLTNNTIDGGSGSYKSYGVIAGGAAKLISNTIDGGSGGRSYGVSNGCEFCGITSMVTLVNNTIDGGSGGRSYGVDNHAVTNTVQSIAIAILVNNSIKSNSGDTSYGIYNYADSLSIAAVTLANNTIDGGSGNDSYGINNTGGTATLANNDIWGSAQDCMIYDEYNPVCTNTASLVNACEWSGCTAASGNISADPLFVDPANGDFHLQAGSPCIDTGINPIPDYIDPSFASIVNFDFEGDARPYGAGWDIGADEWTP